MKLSEEQIKKVKDWMRERIKPCAACGCNSFSVNELMCAFDAYDNKRETVPVVLVFCDGCGLAMPFAAIHMGLITKDGIVR